MSISTWVNTKKNFLDGYIYWAGQTYHFEVPSSRLFLRRVSCDIPVLCYFIFVWYHVIDLVIKNLFNRYSHWAGKTYHIEISPSSCFRGFLWCILLFYFCLISRDILRCVVPTNDFFLSTMLTNNGWWYFVHFQHHKTFLAVRFYIFFIDVCFRRYLFMSSIFYFSSFVDFYIPSKLF